MKNCKMGERLFDIGLLKLGSSGIALKCKEWKKDSEGVGSAITLANVRHWGSDKKGFIVT